MVNKVNKDDDFVKYLAMDMARSKTFILEDLKIKIKINSPAN